jgi:uroporphyrin-3 C-methyltransferase
VIDTPDAAASTPPASSQPASSSLSATSSPGTARPDHTTEHRGWLALAAVLAVTAGISLVLAWRTQQRVDAVEKELVRRLEESQTESAEARLLAKQSQDTVMATAAKLALVEARVAEVAVQRTQLEDLMQSLARSRDENVLQDIDAGLRVAMQQTAITGSAEPLIAMLKQSDARLVSYSQPRLEGVRRAIARDLDRVRAVGVADVPTLGIRLDETVRLIDELPLLSNAEQRAATKPKASVLQAAVASAASSPAVPTISGLNLQAAWNAVSERVWLEAKSLIRVTRIDHPEAMLLAPENAFFVRENLKLRLLNARLALLSRQFDTAQSDLQIAQTTLDRYFDRSSRRTALASDLIRQVTQQARQVVIPRPDDTLVALAAAAAGR